MEVELLVTKRDDQQGEYRAICLGKVGRQSFAIDESFVVLIAMFCPQVLVSSDSPGPKAYQRELGRYFGALPVDKKIDITYDKPGYRRGKWVTIQGTSSPLLTLAEIRVYGSKNQIISYCSLLVLTAVKKARLTSEFIYLARVLSNPQIPYQALRTKQFNTNKENYRGCNEDKTFTFILNLSFPFPLGCQSKVYGF